MLRLTQVKRPEFHAKGKEVLVCIDAARQIHLVPAHREKYIIIIPTCVRFDAESLRDTDFNVARSANDGEVDALEHFDLGGVAGVGAGAVCVTGGDVQREVALAAEGKGQVNLGPLRNHSPQSQTVATCN